MSRPKFDVILQVLIGSHANGYATEDSDRDEQGIAIESLEDFVGFTGFEQYVWRSATDRTGDQFAKSQPGDVDLKIYSLKKFLRLALDGNPDILSILFNKNIIKSNALGAQLQEMYPLIVSKEAGRKYLGYAHGQRQRLLHQQKDGDRQWITDKYGWDVKYGTHIVRLLYQGIELLQTGKISLPIREPELTYCKEVRSGKHSQEDVLKVAEDLEAQLYALRKTSEIREHPDREAVETWMIERYYQWWRSQRVLKDILSFKMDKDKDIVPVWG